MCIMLHMSPLRLTYIGITTCITSKKEKQRNEEKKRKFHECELLLLFLYLVRGGLFVNRATVLVLHLCSLEHLVAFSLLACVFVIAWLAVDLRLIVVGVEVTRIRPLTHIHDESL